MAPIEPVGDGSFRYRWDFRREEVAEPDIYGSGETPRVEYSCLEVIVWGPLTSNKITEAVIGQLWPSNYEQKLINEYLAAESGMYGGSADSDAAQVKRKAYHDFLKNRSAIKEQIDRDCETLGIR